MRRTVELTVSAIAAIAALTFSASCSKEPSTIDDSSPKTIKVSINTQKGGNNSFSPDTKALVYTEANTEHNSRIDAVFEPGDKMYAYSFNWNDESLCN